MISAPPATRLFCSTPMAIAWLAIIPPTKQLIHGLAGRNRSRMTGNRPLGNQQSRCSLQHASGQNRSPQYPSVAICLVVSPLTLKEMSFERRFFFGPIVGVNNRPNLSKKQSSGRLSIGLQEEGSNLLCIRQRRSCG